MIGKVIAYGDTREQAIARMRIALSEMVVEGIKTNIPLHQELLLDEKFLRGGTSIHYLEERLAKRKQRSVAGCIRAPRPRDRVELRRAALRCRRRGRRRMVRRAARGGRAVGRRRPIRARAPPTKTPLFGEPGDAERRAVADRRGSPRCSPPAPTSTQRCAQRAARSARRAAGVRDARESPSRTGCARRRRSSGRSAIDDGFWIVPSWCEPPDARCDQPRARSRPRVRHRLASDDAAVPRNGCARRVAPAAIGARLRLRLGHPRDRGGEARRAPRSSGIDIDPQALSRERGERARATASPRRSSRPMRCRLRRRSTSSSRTSSPIRCACSRRRSPARVRAGGRIALSGILDAQAADVADGVRALVYIAPSGARATAGCCWRARRRATRGACTGRMTERKYTRCPGCADGVPRDAEPARAARRPGALRPLPRRCSTATRIDFARADTVAPEDRRR